MGRLAFLAMEYRSLTRCLVWGASWREAGISIDISKGESHRKSTYFKCFQYYKLVSSRAVDFELTACSTWLKVPFLKNLFSADVELFLQGKRQFFFKGRIYLHF